jgi:RimJ/RimL family protein N-acetyltransferase
MNAPDLQNLANYADVLRLPGGAALTLRFAEPADAARLQRYFRSLSEASRYNRLMGGAAELPATQLEKFVHAGEGGSYSVIAALATEGDETIVGEVRYADHDENASVEFGISVHDRWQGQGVGTALLANLECRAAALGADVLVGDTLRSNRAMLGLARKQGFLIAPTRGDWKQIRLQKQIDFAPLPIACASWRLAAARWAAPRRSSDIEHASMKPASLDR